MRLLARIALFAMSGFLALCAAALALLGFSGLEADQVRIAGSYVDIHAVAVVLAIASLAVLVIAVRYRP